MARLIPGLGNTPKRSNKKRLIVIGSLVLLVAGIGAAVYYFFIYPNTISSLSTDDKEQISGDSRSTSTKLASIKARNLEDAGDIDGAVRLLRTAVGQTTVDDEKVDLLKQVSSIYTNSKNRTEANKAINDALAVEPNSWSLYKSLGLTDEAFGDIEAARAHYLKADKLLEGSPEYAANHDQLLTMIRTAGTNE